MLCFCSSYSTYMALFSQSSHRPKMMIGTLTSSPSSSTNILLQDFPTGNKISPCGTETFPSLLRITFPLKFLRLNSAQSRILKPIPLRSSPINVSQANIGAAETETPEKSSIKIVRVRFQLQKECVFGEHFFILGDDPVFGGLWDLENALPLTWSDGHVWTLDLDLPVGRMVEFKFIRKANTGEILWQPGPNRGLVTWETNKTIRVCEDWENADLQMLIEDSAPVNQEEKQSSSFVNLDMPIVAENITHPKQGVRLNNNVSSNDKEDEGVVLGTVNNSSVAVLENAEYLTNESDENSNSIIQSERTLEPLNGAVTAWGVKEESETKEAMFAEEEAPVLVPGLIPPSHLANEEVNGPRPHVSVEVINKGKAETSPEVGKKEEMIGERNEKRKVKAISLFEKSEQTTVKEAEEAMQQRLETESLLERDIQWGRRTLYKLLSNFGLF